MFDTVQFNERLFFPRPDLGQAPPAATDLMLPVADDVALHARWHHPLSQPTATFLIFHGNGEIVADYDRVALQYRSELACNVVIVDFRGYGRSEGTSTYRNCIADAPLAARAIAGHLRGSSPGRLVALGRSLGGACVAEIARTAPPLVDAIVMESAGAEPLALIARRGLRVPPALSPEETAAFDARPKLAACQLPALVLHGAQDEVISPDEARANFAALTTPHRQLVFVPGRGHNDLFGDAAYWEALRAFVATL